MADFCARKTPAHTGRWYPAARNRGLYDARFTIPWIGSGWKTAFKSPMLSPHTFRHTKAMHLFVAGISPVTIKDILGHANLKTLEIYVQADLEMKRRALKSVKSPIDAGVPPHRAEPDLLHWLEQL